LAEASRVTQPLRHKTRNRVFRVVDGEVYARFRFEICELLPAETAEELLARVRDAVAAIGPVLLPEAARSREAFHPTAAPP
jgi:hypothetical protein